MHLLASLSSSMTLSNLFAILTVGTCLYFLFCLFVAPRISPFRHLPSPDQGPIWCRLIHEPRVPEIEKWIEELPHEGLIRYYGIFNRERIFVASPAAARELLTSNAYRFIKPELQWVLANNIAGEGLLIQEREVHKEARKRFNPAFSPAQMRKWFPSLWETTVEALEALPQQSKLTESSVVHTAVDAAHKGTTSILNLISAASIDMIGHFGFNVDFNTIKNIGNQRPKISTTSKDSKSRFGRAYIHMFKTTKRGQLTLEAASLIGPKIALRLPIPAVKTISGIMGLVRETAEDIVVSHERGCCTSDEKNLVKDDMLTLLMKSDHFSHEHLVEQTVHFFAAGTEKVAATACWAIHLLSRHLDIQTGLRDEIRENVTSPYQTSADSVRDLQFHDLKYLNAVVQEVLRFHSINTLLWRECIEPSTIAGTSISKGTTIVFSPWTLNRDPAYWGPDARSFSPDRWLDRPSGGASHPCSFLTFGAGPRRCIGEQYARDELLCLIAGFVGRYEFTPIDPDKGSDEGQEIGDNFALTLFKIYEKWQLNFRKVPGW